MSRRIAVVGGTPALIECARGLGLDVTFVGLQNTPAAPVPDISLDFTDCEAVVRALRPLHEQRAFDGILSLTETGLVPAAYASAVLGVPGNSLETVLTLRDKVKMRRALGNSPELNVLSVTVRSVSDIIKFHRDIGRDVIVKPVQGQASTGVSRIANESDAQRAWDMLEATGVQLGIAEEYLDGPEYSVEAFSHEGSHNVLAVTAKEVNENFIEISHSMPALLDDATYASIERCIDAFLTRVGLVQGPSHTEIKLGNSGPRIIESHNRIGGDKIRELVLLSTGIDLLTATLRTALGNAVPPVRPRTAKGAAIRFLTASPGTLLSVETPKGLPEGVRLSVDVVAGDKIHTLRSSHDRLGYVIATHEHASGARERAAETASQIVFRVAPPQMESPFSDL